MRKEYDFSKMKGRHNPYARLLKKAVTHQQVMSRLLKDQRFRSGYEKELEKLEIRVRPRKSRMATRHS